MGRSFYIYLVLFIAAIGLAGCDLAGDIAEVGFWLGVILVVVVVVAVFWIVRAVRRKV